MRRKKGFDFAEGIYYFTIASSPRNITLHRKSKQAAVTAFRHYKIVGKEVEWLGQWNGKEFVDSSNPAKS